MTGREWAVTGVIGRPHGLRGEAHVRPDPDIGDEFAPGSHYRADDGRDLEVAESRNHAGRRIVRFVGVDNRDAAVSLRGLVLRVPRADVTLGDDVLWSDEVVGKEAVDDEGRRVGTVAALADGPAHDYLVIERAAGSTVLVPAVEALVTLAEDRVVVQAIPGLLEPDDAT